MSRRGEYLAKHDREICDFCCIITPLDYKVGGIFLFSLILVGIRSNLILSINIKNRGWMGGCECRLTYLSDKIHFKCGKVIDFVNQRCPLFALSLIFHFLFLFLLGVCFELFCLGFFNFSVRVTCPDEENRTGNLLKDGYPIRYKYIPRSNGLKKSKPNRWQGWRGDMKFPGVLKNL